MSKNENLEKKRNGGGDLREDEKLEKKLDKVMRDKDIMKLEKKAMLIDAYLNTDQPVKSMKEDHRNKNEDDINFYEKN